MSSIASPIDPLSHRAAIDALEAQRAAYRRFARMAEAQQDHLSSGDADRVAAFTDGAARTVRDLEAGVRDVRALVDQVSQHASTAQRQDIERVMNAMMSEARNAETAIRNLTTQLEAWRDAYGRQLSDLGITPGATDDATPVPGRRSAYEAGHGGTSAPRILDRKG